MRVVKPQSRAQLAGPVVTAGLLAFSLAGLCALHLWAGEAAATRPGDALALALLRADVDRSPEDPAARLRLVREQLAVGLFQDAEHALGPLLRLGNAAPRDALFMSLQAAVGTWRAAKPGLPDRQAAEADALSRLTAFIPREATVEGLVQGARVARELGRPAIAAQAQERAAALEPDGRRALELSLAAIDAYVAADQGEEGLRLAEKIAGRFPTDRAVLERAEALALARNHPDLARRFGERLMSMGALDAVSLGRQLDLELGAGDLGAALATAERLVAQAPDDPRFRITAANVSIWAGRPERALLHWTWLAARRAAPGALDQALSLAKALRDDGAIVQLLRLRGRKEPLPLAAVAELAHALESLEAPRDAIAALREYAARHPQSREAWEGLAATQERRREFTDALQTRQEMSRRFGPRLSDALAIARLLWALNRPADALAGLVRWGDAATALDVEYWEVLAEIAWQEEADATALRAYRALWDSNRIDVSGAERLLLLTRANGRPEDLIPLGQQSWRRMHQPRFLLLAMDEAARAGRWGELEQMAADAADSSDGFTELPAFWMLRARIDERAGRVQDAVAAYRRALAGDPKNAAARSGVIWLLAGAHQRQPLSEYLTAWAKDAEENPDLSRAWLAGHEELEMARPGPAQPVAGSVGTEVGGESIGTAVLAQQRAFLRSGLTGGGEMEVSGGFTGFLSGDARLPLPGTETRVSARAVFPGLGGLTEAAAGIGLRRDSNVLSGRVARTQIFPALGEMRLEGSLHEPADESLALRAQAVRNRVGGAVAVSEGRAYQRLAGDWKSWSTRGGTALGTGGSATVEIGWRMQAPDLVVRLQGGYQRNSLRQSGLPSGVTAFAENPADILPDELASLGAGIGAARLPMGPVHLSGDVWLGWMGPPSRAAFRVQAGATVAPFKNAELGVIAFAANDRWSAGGNVGLTLSLTHRFGL